MSTRFEHYHLDTTSSQFVSNGPACGSGTDDYDRWFIKIDQALASDQ
jgi:hypothetical protein